MEGLRLRPDCIEQSPWHIQALLQTVVQPLLMQLSPNLESEFLSSQAGHSAPSLGLCAGTRSRLESKGNHSLGSEP